MQNVKKDLIDLMGKTNLEESHLIDVLISALNHEEKSVVIGASLMLGRLQEESAVPGLLKTFLTNDQEIGAAVAWALGQCRMKVAVPFLTKAIEKGFAVANSCEALGNLEDTQALPSLCNALASEKEDVKLCAIKALSCLIGICDASQRDAILRNLDPLLLDVSRKVRICAGVVCHRISNDSSF